MSNRDLVLVPPNRGSACSDECNDITSTYSLAGPLLCKTSSHSSLRILEGARMFFGYKRAYGVAVKVGFTVW